MLRTRRHLFFPGPERAWSAVIDRSGPDEGELAWIRPEEVLLYAALTLSEKRPSQNGRVIIAPIAYPGWVEMDLRRFGTPASVAELSRHAGRLATEVPAPRFELPESLSDIPESVDSGSAGDARRLLAAMDMSNALLLRGLSKYVTANHLVWYHAFLEEGGLAALVALEAALELLRRQIGADQQREVSFVELFKHLDAEADDGPAFVAYLKELYEARILLVHPANRIGTYWTPPVQVDDCFSCIDVATYIYRRLLLGEIAG